MRFDQLRDGLFERGRHRIEIGVKMIVCEMRCVLFGSGLRLIRRYRRKQDVAFGSELRV